MKVYSLEEMYIIGNRKYWSIIITSDDITMLRKLKKIYQEKDKLGIYRIVRAV